MIDGVLNRDVLSFEIEKSCIDDKKVIGSFQKNSATIELLNPDNKYSNLKGTYINTYKGTFYVDNIEPIQEKIKIKLSCYDLAQKFEKLYDSSKFTFPLTLKAWRNAICTEVGVEYDNTDFPNSDYELSNEPYIKKDATYKDVIKLIAQASSCWTIIDYDDKLYFNWFNNTLIEVQDWFDLTTEDEPTDPVNIVVLGRGVVEDNVIYPEIEPANPKEIRIDSNDILDLNRKKMIVPIYNQVKDFKYTVFSMKTIGFLNAKIGNKIKYPDLYNNKKESYIMCHKLTFLGGDYSDKRNYTSQFEAVELDETSTNYKYAESIEERIDKTEIITNKLNGEIRSITTKVTKVTNTANDALQKANDGLSNVNVQYYLSTSNTTLSGGTWSDNAPSWVDGKYMWSRTKVTNAKGEVSYEPSINGTCIAGATGATGKDGINGKDGVNGKSITIKSKAIEYQASTSGTSAPTGTWTTTIPNVNKGSYLWTRTTVTYSDDTNTVSYSVAYRGTDGTDGTNGTNGTNGKDGKGITSITYYYATSTSQTAPSEANITSTTIPTLNATNKYLWQKEVIKFSDNTNKTSILLIAVYGDKGQTGATGKGVKSIVEQYYLSSSNATQTGGDWSNTQPNWVNGKYIWTRSHITWSDNTTTDTTPILANGLNNANSTATNAISMADSAKKDVQNTNENLMNNYYTISQTNELVQTAEDGLVNAYTTTGGANIFVNTGLWFVNDNNDQNVNPYEDWKGKALRKSNDEASNGNSILLQNGTFEQEQEVPNGNYSISFMYKKLISQSVASVVINGKEYQLNSTTLKEFYTGEKNEKNEYITEPIVVTAGHLKIQFKCNTNGGVEIYDLMANKGSIKLAYSQNQNETTTETVKISKGITITSTNMETIFKANANGIRILSLQNEKIAYFTDKGLSTKELTVENKAQMCSTLISEVGDQTWFTRM
jgi:hypothetical protein